ncbi:MAG: hypothetical protein HYU69_12095 [Bacteroidetes bacterium]|nr:hypothetical protein [Bacteroidota bacterium]
MPDTTSYLEALTALIKETEGKLQNTMKDGRNGNGIESLRTILKYLREKQKELQDSANEKK